MSQQQMEQALEDALEQQANDPVRGFNNVVCYSYGSPFVDRYSSRDISVGTVTRVSSVGAVASDTSSTVPCC